MCTYPYTATHHGVHAGRPPHQVVKIVGYIGMFGQVKPLRYSAGKVDQCVINMATRQVLITPVKPGGAKERFAHICFSSHDMGLRQFRSIRQAYIHACIFYRCVLVSVFVYK